MPLVREPYDDSVTVNYYGEPIESFREEWEFEVDGIRYIHPWKRYGNGNHPQIVRPMFELKSDEGC